jgi:hypothetical protein
MQKITDIMGLSSAPTSSSQLEEPAICDMINGCLDKIKFDRYWLKWDGGEVFFEYMVNWCNIQMPF